MPAVYSVVDCAEIAGSRVENWDLPNVSASVQLRCEYSQAHALLSDVFYFPRKYPWSISPPMWPKRVNISPHGETGTQDGQSILYDEAIITIQYEASSREPKTVGVDTVYVTERISSHAEFFTDDYTKYMWGTSVIPLTAGEAPGTQVRTVELLRTIEDLRTLPAGLLTLDGSVNDAPYVSSNLGITFATGTLLFEAPEVERSYLADGSTTAWKLSQRYKWRETDWNYFRQMEKGTHDLIQNIETGVVVYPYPYADFTDFLF